MEHNPQFLQKRYPDFHNNPEVDAIAEKLKDGFNKSDLIELIKDKIKPHINAALRRLEVRIQNFLDDQTKSLDLKNPQRAENLKRMKTVLNNQYVIKAKDFSDSYFAMQKRIARE